MTRIRIDARALLRIIEDAERLETFEQRTRRPARPQARRTPPPQITPRKAKRGRR